MIEMLDGLFGLKLSEGAIANMLARAEKPFAAHASEIAPTSGHPHLVLQARRGRLI
jgi:hypothetical protein